MGYGFCGTTSCLDIFQMTRALSKALAEQQDATLQRLRSLSTVLPEGAACMMCGRSLAPGNVLGPVVRYVQCGAGSPAFGWHVLIAPSLFIQLPQRRSHLHAMRSG